MWDCRTPDAGDDIDADAAIGTQLMLLAALTADAQYDDAGLGAFMAEARALTDEWTS